jgi:hypothetical protein
VPVFAPTLRQIDIHATAFAVAGFAYVVAIVALQVRS